MTEDPAQRTQLTAVRGFLAVLGGFIVAAATIPLVELLGDGNPARGWQMVALIYASLVTVMFFICFKSTHERVFSQREGKSGGLHEIIKVVLSNRQ
ncbi:MAG: MFS transporter [Bacillota bacterium]